jgi:hypothetical protein
MTRDYARWNLVQPVLWSRLLSPYQVNLQNEDLVSKEAVSGK